ncbi:MAG: peptidoglycan-associated lipoprotein Pal [Deltaproteobacteria bacterium]|nr:peptidoglycan-associated lipoprotein Pal [Deltaproteobacteria bacterium]
MKRHGLILFLVALLALPIVTVTFTSCAQQQEAVKKDAAPAPKSDEAEKAMLERLKKERAEADKARKAKMAAWQKEMEVKRLREAKIASKAAKASFHIDHAYFDFDKYFIRSDAEQVLRAKAEYMKANSKTRVEIQGHCDERGTVDYNLALGDRRAHAAASFIISLGINADRIETVTYGEEKPVDKGHNQTAWAKNRRAQFIIISE